MVHNLEHYRHNSVLIEDQRVLKIKQLKSQLIETEVGPRRQLFLEEISSFEFRELKEKKAIFMNDTGSKIFYRIQNMGVVFWDYFTGESRRVKIDIPNYSFYSAVCAFEHPSSKILKLFDSELDQAHHFMIISVLEADKKDSRSRLYMLFDIDDKKAIATFGQKSKPKGKNKIKTQDPKEQKLSNFSILQEKEVLFIYECCQLLKFNEEIHYDDEQKHVKGMVNLLYLQDCQENYEWETTMNQIKLESFYKVC